jgi:hypothetical protein
MPNGFSCLPVSLANVCVVEGVNRFCAAGPRPCGFVDYCDDFIHTIKVDEKILLLKQEVPMESQLVFLSIATVTVLSGATATVITLTVDVRSRPGIQSLVEGLMRIAILGAGTLVALTDGGSQLWV